MSVEKFQIWLISDIYGTRHMKTEVGVIVAGTQHHQNSIFVQRSIFVCY
jgi:hypothetical protein